MAVRRVRARARCSISFPTDYLLVVDESHATIPQIGGMYAGDRSRKTVLVEHGFRLPSALDNRPLELRGIPSAAKSNDLCQRHARPHANWNGRKGRVVEQIVRPTGLIDPKITVKPLTGQIDDLINEVPQTCRREGARAGDDPDQTHRGRTDGLPARHRNQCPVSAQRN